MRDSESPYLSGRLLIAMPGIGDERFERAVILVCSHTPNEAMGLTLNRPVDGLTVSNLLKRMGVKYSKEAPEDLVLMGGPVENQRGFVLHTDDYVSEPSSRITRGIAMTTTRDVLEALTQKEVRPRRAVMALGYAGWGAGQLERELKENVWLTCEPDEALIFGDDHDHKWSAALAKLGVSAEFLSSEAGHA